MKTPNARLPDAVSVNNSRGIFLEKHGKITDTWAMGRGRRKTTRKMKNRKNQNAKKQRIKNRAEAVRKSRI